MAKKHASLAPDRNVWSIRREYARDGAVNPWAVCNSSVGTAKTAKRERCIRDVKAKSPIKED